ncbi:MAG TPA: serine/threonine-protein kinase [Myxococcota bacterium]|nr:serine/threonine-protein kinase [Myxococcota bacterium]
MSDAETQKGSGSIIRPPGTVIGSYRLVQMIAEGGMGRVYLAEHVKLGRRVALKVLRSEYAANPVAVKRFFGEARAVNQINNENIVEITDFIEQEGADNYYIMELLDGRSLADALEQDKIIPVGRALGIAIQMAQALAAVHRAGIVHRDLKPDNIFLTEKGGRKDFIKLLDFGVAKLIDVAENIPTHKTAAGAILGTPEYMSPEQAGGRNVDFRTDIYAFGVILYEMLAGRKPLNGKSYGELVIQHMTVTPTRFTKLKDLPQRVPKSIEELIMQCLEKEAGKRPADMTEIAERLGEIGRAESITVESFTPAVPGGRRSGLLAAGLVVAVVVAGVAGLAIIKGSKGEGQTVSKPDAQAIPAEPDLVGISFDLDKVEVRLDTTPEGATVFEPDNEKPLGITPLPLSFKRTDEKKIFELRLAGYKPVRQEVSLLDDTRVMVNLAREDKPLRKPHKKKLRKKKRIQKTVVTPDAGIKEPPDRGGTIDPFKDM